MTDVFIGLRKGKNGEYYVFVRYVDVKNVREMERKLDDTMVRGRRLEVNVALHKRKEIPGMTKNENQGHNSRHSSAFIPKKPPGGWGFKDQRTFAEVVGRGRNDVHNSHSSQPSTPPHIILQKDQYTHCWLRKTSLIGEAVSLNHLGHLPKLLLIKNEVCMEIKYVGGFKVLLQFNDSVSAKEFKENKQRWQEHLKWVDWADQVQTGFDGVSWIRIVGLPLQLLGENNFEKITKDYGNIIAPYDNLTHHVDLSYVKIGILTTRRKRINEEILVAVEGEILKLGIIELDEDWYPFKFDPDDEFYEKDDLCVEDEDEEEEDNVDGVSDTWVQEGDCEMQEGEISLVSNRKTDPKVMMETNQISTSSSENRNLGRLVETLAPMEEEQGFSGRPQTVEITRETIGKTSGKPTTSSGNGNITSPLPSENMDREHNNIKIDVSAGPTQ
ncbi:unnamed protein product [Lactuca virosa]|uniref:DUF4283 domain-containing protein n=1 Tax=Lactuca virosa TaxID=75947 RepID=A0AAU9NUL4_9ASTR|nr:unnamed protein product [Lactuca virosa]